MAFSLLVKIAIIGCGWLGTPLALQLHHQGHDVMGTSRSSAKLQQLDEMGITGQRLDLNPEALVDGDLDFLTDRDAVVMAIPPMVRKHGADYHFEQCRSVAKRLSGQKGTKCYYISSTSVYPNTNQLVDESLAMKESTTGNPTLWRSERYFQETLGRRATIMRMGGLMGYDRMPLKYHVNKAVSGGENQVNYIHRDDAVGLVQQLVTSDLPGNIYNAVAPEHPTRKALLIRLASAYQKKVPEFVEPSITPHKVVDSSKIQQNLQFRFLFPDPLDFTYSDIRF